MARGPGMQIDEDKAGIQPTGIGTGQVRGFSTDLPNFDNSAQINAGAKIASLGEELLHIAGQESARAQAQSAPLERDPVTGAYKRPDAPVMGLLTADTYNKIVDQRMTEQVVHDFETQANKIAADHFNNPEAAGPLLTRLRESTLKAVGDPRMVGLVQGHIDTEVLQRMNGIQNYAARQAYQNEVGYLNEAEKLQTEKAIGLLQIGATDEAMKANAMAESARARRVEMHADDARELDLADVRWGSLKNSATLLNRVEHELETNPERIPDTVRRLDAMLRGGGSDEDEVLGFTKQGLMTKIGSQAQRDQLGARLQRTLQDYYLKAQAKANTVDPADFESFYQANPRSGKNHDWTAAQEGQLVQGYMRAKGLDPYAGATVEHMWQLTGRVADSFYGPLFERAITKSPVQLARLAEVYDTINGLKDPAGNPVGAGAQVMNENDAAYMKVFRDALHDAPADPKKAPEEQLKERALYAKKEADSLYTKGVDKLSEVKGVGGYAAAVNRELEVHGLPRLDTDKMVADAKTRFDPLGPGEGGMRELSGDNALELVRGIAARMVKGNYSYEQARDESVKRFQETHHQSDYVIAPGTNKPGGWVRHEYGVPQLDDLSKGGGTAKTETWLKGYVDGTFKLTSKGEVLDETKSGKDAELMIPRFQRGQKIENPELGKNVFMVPKGVSTENQQFSLVYKDQGGNLIPLQTAGGRDVLIRVGAEAKRQAAEIAKRFTDPEYRRYQEERERSIGGAVMGGLGGGMGSKIDERYPVAPAPVDPLKIVDPTVYGDTTEPNLQQTKNARGGSGGKPLSYPRRRDGMTDPMTDLPYPDPDNPGRKAGNVSLEEPGYRGFRIPGMDGPTHLVSVARDENTQFYVRNQAGPRAGEVVTIHPDFAVGLAAMVEAMPKEVKTEFKIGSAVRSYDQQSAIYRAAQAKRGDSARMWAAPPGHSNHEHGIAADLSMGPAAKAWVHANAGRFGLWFPMKHEPWHVEPIGSRQRADAGSDTEAS